MSIIGMRAALAAIVFAIFRKGLKIRLTTGNCLAALCLSGTTILFVFANQLTTAAAAILLQFTSPVWVLIMQFVFYRRKPKLSEALAVVFTLFGMLLFFGDELGEGNMLGNMLAIGSGLTFAGVIFFNKRPDADPEHSIMLGFYVNALVWLPFAFFDQNIMASTLAWWLIVLLGVVQVGLAYVFFSVGIKTTPALLASLIIAFEPVLNPLWVAIFTSELPGRFALTGGAVIIVTIVIYNIWVEKRSKNAESGMQSSE
jgi:drug/metabolite transporter (DMT)-like permease